MSTFREFEHGGWEDPALCAAYDDRLGAVVAQSIGPLLDAARVTAADRLVDVATGTGAAAAAAAGRGTAVLGVDFSAEQLRRARAQHPAIGFVQGDAGALPLAGSSVDAVVSGLGMPHFPDPGAFLRECGRVLRPTGRLAFTVWAPPARSPVFAALFAAVAQHGTLDVGLPAGPDFFRYADLTAATADLTAAGLADVSADVVGQIWTLPDTYHVVEALLRGTVRMGALLARQPPGALDRIRRDVADRLAAYDDGPTARIPMPVVVVSAAKP
jgi:SAM-dependent methyltransferase